MCDERAADSAEARVTLNEVMLEAARETCPNVDWPDQDIHIFEERWKSKGA